jgi:predicted ATPase
MDVRPSDITELEEKVKKLSYGKYLSHIKMINVRSFTNQDIRFDFPITAIIGTNGGGKSTILGAAALAYKDIKPGDFFPKSNIGDNSMANWRIEYDVIDRSVNKKSAIQRNARFVSAKWRRDNILERDVVVIPIQRTVPANEQAKFKKFIGIKQRKGTFTKNIDPTVATSVSRILGKDASGYKRISISKSSDKSILVGMANMNDYSQFHFGAGEASVIDMVTKIEESEENSLILIEEIENGLHPIATHRMVEYLFDVAKRKKSQIIFTTHSEYALKALPPQAIWACIEGRAYQGKLTIESLRALTGSASKEGAIFVEDQFVKDFCEEMIRQIDGDMFHKAEVHAAGGYPYVADVAAFHNQNPSIKHKAVALIDGDNPSDRDNDEYVVRLMDGTPEGIVFGYIHDNIETICGLIKQRCQCPSIKQDDLIAAIKKVMINTTDHHLYFSKLGDEMGYISEIVVRRGIFSIYVENNKDILEPIVNKIKKILKI